jgi:aminopeptidase N
VHLDLTAGADPAVGTFRSTTTITLDAAPGTETWLDLIAPTVHAVSVDGVALDVADVVADHRVRLDGLGGRHEVRVVADCAYMTTGEGLHRFRDPADDATYCYTQFEVADARRVFPTFEQPDLKATFAFTVDVPAGWLAISVQPEASREPLEGGATRVRFTTTPRLSTYVVAVCAGPYHEARDEYHGAGGAVPLGLFCRQSLAEHLDADALFDVTKRGFAYFEAAFDQPYPFEKYDQLFVPEFNAGAMENAGCVTYRDEYLFRSRVTDAAYERRAETVLHEMAHMWFGDLVTMRWWDDLWLNESFATWASVLAQAEATRWTESWTTFATAEKLWALRQDQLPSTHPVQADMRHLEDVEVNFDGITYAKGAAVLKQLVAWVGRDAFFEGLRRYFRAHAWGNTTLADLFTELEATSGRDLGSWEQEWLGTAGVSVLRPEVSLDDDGARYASVHVVQEPPAAQPVLRGHRIAIGLYDVDDAGQLVRRDRLELDVTGARTPVPALTGVAVPDLLLLNDDDLTFVRLRLDERSLASAVTGIGAFADSLPRALVWTATTDMLRSAEMAAHDYVALVLAGVASERDASVLLTVLQAGRGAVELYADPTRRPALRKAWADGLRTHAAAAAAGSDAQLAIVRAWASAAHEPAHLAELQALLDGDAAAAAAFPGLTLDRDLRWHLLQRLVAHGAADEAAITAEEALDPTASGRNQAVLARAARPGRDAKQATWDALVAGEAGGFTNRDTEMALAGFELPEHAEVLAEFVAPYFAAVEGLWTASTMKTAERLATGLFPRVVVTDAVAAQARALAATTEHPGLARLLLEGAADVERALAAQARDAAGAVSAA